MLEIGLEQKGKSHIASALHLPTNTLIKCSAESEDKAIAKCISDINVEIANYDWLCTEDDGEYVRSFTFNGILKFAAKGLKIVDLECAMERALKQTTFWHRFTKENKIYSSCKLDKGKNISYLFESVLSIKGVEYENC